MDGYIGEIRMFAGSFAPRGWALCQGQLFTISQNQALFAILGTTYGGNGTQTFGLPDLRGRAPVGQGQGLGLPPVYLGEMAGSPTVTLLSTNMPMHNHTATIVAEPTIVLRASANQASQSIPGTAGANTLAAPYDATNLNPINGYVSDSAPGVQLAGASITGGAVTIGVAGGSQPFSIQSPYIGLNFIIALEGVFPTRD